MSKNVGDLPIAPIPERGSSSLKRGRMDTVGKVAGRRVVPRIDWKTSTIGVVIEEFLSRPRTKADIKRLRDALSKANDPVANELSRLLKQKGVLSKEDVVSCLLTDMKTRVFADLRQGKVVVTDDTEALKEKYLGSSLVFCQDSTIARDILAIHKEALIEQEIVRLERRLASGQNIVEKILIEQIADTCENKPSEKEVKGAQISALRDLRHLVGEFSPHDVYEREIFLVKFTAQLKAYGLDEEKIGLCVHAFENILPAWQRLEAESRTLLEQSLDDIPKIQRERVIHMVMDEFEELFLRPVMEAIRGNYSSSAGSEAASWLDVARSKEGVPQMIAAVESGGIVSFMRKWGAYLQEEVVQGFPHPGEDLGNGVCQALVNRWVVERLEGKSLTDVGALLGRMELGSISGRDRFNQAFLRATSLSKNSDQIARAEETLFGIRDIQYNFRENLVAPTDDQARVVEALTQFFGEADEMLQAHNGIARFEIHGRSGEATEGHSIYVEYQPGTHTFNIIDPNCGFFRLSSKEEFFECLADLTRLLYDWSASFGLVCFEPKEPEYRPDAIDWEQFLD